MKKRILKNTLLFILGVILLPIINSCDVDEDNDVRQPVAYEATWKDDFKLKFNPVGEDATGSFEFNYAPHSGEQFWGITEIEYEVALDMGDFLLSEIDNIKLYIFAEEKVGENFNYIGGNDGILLETINNPSETFQLMVTKDQIANLFDDLFTTDHNGDILADDVFEIKWVVTGTDGKVLDTRKDCFGFDCTYGFGTNVIILAPPIWEGTFNYEWIAATANATYYGGVSVGDTGTMTFTLQPGSFTVYDVSHLTADYRYGGPGTLTYDYDSGLVEIEGRYNQHWDIVAIDGPTLTIDFSYSYSASYDEYGTFTLTRTDGEDWPTNLYTN